MGSIDDIKSILTQSALDALCEKFHIPRTDHPELPSRNDRIRNSPIGKIGVYTRFFNFANYQIPLSQFFVDVFEYFQINLSQLSVIAAAKSSHFEILCRVHSFVLTNDHFFWVDASVFPFFVPWHNNKTLRKDPHPTPSEFNMDVCNYLAANTALFRKFPESFLCFVGISRCYELDDNCYPTFLTDDDEEMDLFSFIHHVDPTKVRIGEREVREGEDSLLELTRGRVVPLAGVNKKETSVRVFRMLVAQNTSQYYAEMDYVLPSLIMLNLLSKVRIGERKVREGEVSLLELTRGRVVSLTSINDQGDVNIQDVGHAVVNEEGVVDGHENPVDAGINKRKATRGASGSILPPKKFRDDYGTSGAGASTGGKFLVALQSLLEGSTLTVEVGVAATATVPFVTSSVTLTPELVATLPFITSFVSLTSELEGDGRTNSATRPNLRTQHASKRFVVLSGSPYHSSSNAADAEVSSVARVGDELVYASIFVDSTFAGMVGPDIAWPSQPARTELSSYTFYVSQDLDFETLQQIYVPKWNVVNDSALDDAEFNVGAVCQTYLSTEVRLWSEHNYMEKKKFENRFQRQADLLKEKDAEITSLKAQLSPKEAETAEAIRLRGQVSIAEATKVARVAEVNDLKERITVLEGPVVALESTAVIKDTELASSNVSGYELFKEQYEAEWILSRGLRLVFIKCLQSPEYLTAFEGSIGHAIDKADYVSAVEALRAVDFPFLAQLAT
ncbi:hypothetical protein Tco_0763613 [Tanacetum coccineum]